MINMQSAFLIVSRHYSEKQAGVLFFGMWSNRFLPLKAVFQTQTHHPNIRLLHVVHDDENVSLRNEPVPLPDPGWVPV